MKSLASLLLIAAAVSAGAQEPPPGEGPRGSSQAVPGEARFDAVGLAAVVPMPGVAAAVRGLAAGGFAEVTALDSGRTIMVLVAEGQPDGLASLSPTAAAALGLTTGGDVRVRPVQPSPQDAAALRQGRAASARIDAPPALLGPLRKRLPQTAEAPPPPRKPAGLPPPLKPRPVAIARPAPTPAATGSYWVQVAALANAANARTLAARVGGTVTSDGALHRVRIGPMADRTAAERARARAAALGYRDAAISRVR